MRAAFPRWWAEQMKEIETADLPLDAALVVPLAAPAGFDASPSLPAPPRGLAGWLWFLAVALLAVERWVVWRHSRREAA